GRGRGGALGHLDLVVDGGIALTVVGRLVPEQGREAAQRGEAPLLHVAARDLVLGDLERALARPPVQRGVGRGGGLPRQGQVLLLELGRRSARPVDSGAGGDRSRPRRMADGLVGRGSPALSAPFTSVVVINRLLLPSAAR